MDNRARAEPATTGTRDVLPVHGAYRWRPAERRPSYVLLSADANFIKLRRRFVVATVLVVTVSLAWYLTYLFLSVYARGFMAEPIYGSINVALLMGIGQFVSTFVLAWAYCGYANRRIDPYGARIRDSAADGAVIHNGRVVRG